MAQQYYFEVKHKIEEALSNVEDVEDAIEDVIRQYKEARENSRMKEHEENANTCQERLSEIEEVSKLEKKLSTLDPDGDHLEKNIELLQEYREEPLSIKNELEELLSNY